MLAMSALEYPASLAGSVALRRHLYNKFSNYLCTAKRWSERRKMDHAYFLQTQRH